jgi:hypothetical protein
VGGRPHIPSHARGNISGAHPQSAAWECSIADRLKLFCRRSGLQERQNRRDQHERTGRSNSLHVGIVADFMVAR